MTNKNKLDEFLNDGTDEGTVCDLNGKCVQKHIKRDKSIVEVINKTIIVEDGRQLLM